jgi:hypothetical protein
LSPTTFGNRQPDPDLDFPEDCIQSIVNEWWTVADDRDVKKGRLLWTHVPFVDWLPYELVPESRASATEHARVLFELRQRRFSQSRAPSNLPIAALPQNPGETYSVYCAKRRPVLVLSAGGTEVDSALTRRQGRWQRTQTLIVAPYFGAERSAQRRGWNPVLAKKIKHAEFSQFFWDKLPILGADESILRFDQLQPIGRNHEAFEATPYKLSGEAMDVVEEWLEWYLFGRVDPDGVLQLARQDLFHLF